MKAVVTKAELKAALCGASADSFRPGLCGVCIQTRPDKQPLLVGTDGRIAIVVESGCDQPEDPVWQMVLPSVFVRAVLAAAVGKEALVTLEELPDALSEDGKTQHRAAAKFAGRAGPVTMETESLTGFPKQWETAIDVEAKESAIIQVALDPRLLARTVASAAALGHKEGKGMALTMSGGGPVRIVFNGVPNLYTVIMPMRFENHLALPPFIVEHVATATAKAGT